MSNIIRLAKSGSTWTKSELAAYNIVVVDQDEETFFGGPLPNYTGPAGFFQHEDIVDGLDAVSLRLMKHLELAMRQEESAVDAFSVELLRAMGYEGDNVVTCAHHALSLDMCGEQVYAKTDVCLTDFHSGMLLLVEEDKLYTNRTNPEPQLVAEAIAASQTNNTNRINGSSRDANPMPALESQVIPGITMIGTFLRFYKIHVTSALDQSIQGGTPPTVPTTVYRHTPLVPIPKEGMKPLANRVPLLKCYEAFKKFLY